MEIRADLISRAYVLAEYDRQHKGPPGGARKIMEEAPAVDAVPVTHGRWTEKRWITDYDWGLINHRALVCTACSVEITDGEKTPYCPYCGAKMDSEQEAR